MKILIEDVRDFNKYNPKELTRMDEHGAYSREQILRVLLENGEILEATAQGLINLIKRGKPGTKKEDIQLIRKHTRRGKKKRARV